MSVRRENQAASKVSLAYTRSKKKLRFFKNTFKIKKKQIPSFLRVDSTICHLLLTSKLWRQQENSIYPLRTRKFQFFRGQTVNVVHKITQKVKKPTSFCRKSMHFLVLYCISKSQACIYCLPIPFLNCIDQLNKKFKSEELENFKRLFCTERDKRQKGELKGKVAGHIYRRTRVHILIILSYMLFIGV